MDDTRADIAEKVRQMFLLKTPLERLKMGFSMYETSKFLVARAIWENTPIYSAADLRQELFLKFYGNDFDSAEKAKILAHFGKAPPEQVLYHCNFEHIPESEKDLQWWRLIYPLVNARLSRKNPENSKLLKVLGSHTWRDVKNSIEIAFRNVKDGERILSCTSEIKTSPNPDEIIDDMFAELRTVPYLLLKGFKNISYSQRGGLDFKAEFNGKVFHIESTYVHGPDFKTQEFIFTNPAMKNISSIYKIRPDKLIALFERTYLRKKEQVLRHLGTADDSLIIMISDLEETYAPWLEHAKIEGVHPLCKLILDWEIPVVIFGAGSVYEPHMLIL